MGLGCDEGGAPKHVVLTDALCCRSLIEFIMRKSQRVPKDGDEEAVMAAKAQAKRGADKLAAVVAYAETCRCRRVQILNYFGEKVRALWG